MSKLYGCDISEHNGNFDVTGQRFVIIRVGYGHFALDRQFVNNVKKCIAKGIPFGVYHYSYALNTVEAKVEADAVLRTIEPYKRQITCGVWFDMEDADGWKAKHGFQRNHATIAPICWTFCKTIEDAGYYAGIYCSESWLGYLKPENDRFDKWTASWGRNDGRENVDVSKYGTMGQYTSVPYDKDVMYQGLIYKNKFGHGAKQAVAPAPVPKLHVGDTVRVKKAITWDGKPFKSWYPAYRVMEVKGNRIVIGVGSTVTAAVHAANLQKVS